MKITERLARLRLCQRLAVVEQTVKAEADAVPGRLEHVRREAAERLANAVAPLARCARCGVVVDTGHPAVTVMRKGIEPSCAICLWCKAEATRHGFAAIKRESA